MKRCQLTILSTAVFSLVGLLAPNHDALAESPNYQSPNFYGATQAGGGQSWQTPPFPASPLAGGAPAAQGDAFMDAHGQPIVMPANYCQSCPSGGCYQGGPYGDPMAVDFGGYTQDQCGPYYFDVSIETVFLSSEDFVGGSLVPFSSSAVGAAPPPAATTNPRLVANGQDDDYEAGWQIALRHDLGPLSVFEATYMGVYDFGFDLTAQDPNNLFSIFSQYGVAPDPADNVSGIEGLDGSDIHNLNYQSDLQSTELTYRRYWVGSNPRVSGTILAGARYFRMTEDLVFSAYNSPAANAAIGTPNDLTGRIDYASKNDLVGFQIGGDAWACLRQGLRLGLEGKAGVFNNRFKFDSNNFIDPAVGSTTPVNPQSAEDGNQVAFAAEGGISLVADILPSWSIKGGYQFIYMDSMVALKNNVATTQYFTGVPAGTNTPVLAPALNTEGTMLYHGFHGGLEYVW